MTADRPTQRLRGIGIVTAGILTISFDALLVRLAAVDGWNVAFWRGLLMAMAMYLFGKWQSDAGAKSAPDCKVVWLAGATLAISSLSLVLAFTLTKVANAVVILSSAPLFTAILSHIFMSEKCAHRTWFSILVCIGGVLWVMSGSIGNINYIGDLLAVVCALSIGVYLTLFRRHPAMSMTKVITRGGLLMALLTLPIATPLQLPWSSYGWLAISGLVQMPLGLVLMTIGTRYLPAAEVSLFLLLETIMAPIWVWLILGEVPPTTTFAGGGLILLTLILHSMAGYFQNNSR
jgi:drug/metabolite transporter (DMT)-like permease